MSTVLNALVTLPPWLVLVLVFLLPAAEASLFLGLVVPGETTVIIGGVIAHAGGLPLAAVIAAASVGAVVGDQVGFLVGRRHGDRLLQRLPSRIRRSGQIERAVGLIGSHGAFAVAIGRWAAALRALVPGLAGLAGMSQTRFTIANASSGVAWGTTMAVLGYLAGATYHTVERRIGVAGDVLVAVIVVALVLWLLGTRRREGRPSDQG